MDKIKVLHSVHTWLSQTSAWLYFQVKFLPEDIINHIVCESIQNSSQFYLPNIHCICDVKKWKYYWDLSMKRLGVRHHFNYQVCVAESESVDIIHSHFGDRGWADITVAKKAQAKHVVTFYGLDVNYLPKTDNRWYDRYHELFRNIDLLLCEGPFMAKSVIALGCPENKVNVHHLGVNVKELKYIPRIYKDGEKLRVLMASSFREKKGIPYGIDALGKLRKEIPLELTIIGDSTEEKRFKNEKERILDSIERNNMSSETRLLGYQPYSVLLEEAYKHHIYLSPSITASDGDTEGGAPVTIIEMMATGMPVVSTRHCDIPEIVHHGVSGLLAEERNVDDLYSNLKWFVENTEKWSDICKAGRKHIENEFDVQKQSQDLARIYQKIMG